MDPGLRRERCFQRRPAPAVPQVAFGCLGVKVRLPRMQHQHFLPQPVLVRVGKFKRTKGFREFVEQRPARDQGSQQGLFATMVGGVFRQAVEQMRRRRGLPVKSSGFPAKGLAVPRPDVRAGAPRLPLDLPQSRPECRKILILNLFFRDSEGARFQPRFQPGNAFRRIERASCRFHVPYHGIERARLRQNLLHRRHAFRRDQRIRVLARRQCDESERLAGFQQRQRSLRRPAGGPLARGIAIETQHRLVRHAPQQLDLAFGQRGAERRDRRADPGANQRDHIHIAFRHHDAALFARRRPCRRHVVEHLALVEERRIRRVEIFGLLVGLQRPRAESDGPAAPVGDREHYPSAETVVGGAAILGPDQQPGLDQHRLIDRLTQQSGLQRAARIRRVTQPERRNRLLVQPAPRQVLPPLAGLERAFEKRASRLHHLDQGRPRLLPRALLRRRLRHLDPRLPGQPLDRFRERQILRPHQKPKLVPMGPAPEAVVEAFGFIDKKAGRLFVVEGAEAGELVAFPDQLDAAADQRGEADAVADFIQKIGRKGHCGPLRNQGRG